MQDDSTAGRRTPSGFARTRRAALALVQPANEQIGRWQDEVSRLVASARHAGGGGRGEVLAAAEALAGRVREAAQEFESAVRAAPPAVAQDSHVEDTRKSMATLLRRLGEIRCERPG